LKEITILIPTYNRSELLNKNLESINQQNFGGSIKCVISDNNSPDDTPDLVNMWKTSKNKNFDIEYIRNMYDIPPIDNFIQTTKNIDTEYAKFLQDDDWLEPRALSQMSKYVKQYDAESYIFNCNIYSIKEKKPRENYYRYNTGYLSANEVVNSFLRLGVTLPTSPSISLQKTELILASLEFGKKNKECSKLLLGNDLIFSYYPIFNGVKTIYIDDALVNFWGGEDSITIYADKHLFSSCYFKSLITLLEEFNYEPSKEQIEVIRHRIFVFKIKSLYKKSLKNIVYDMNFDAKLSKKELKKFIKNKVSNF
jgi:glycosyltransferase involved in cell wall biosynthesis